jgi:hypothetical protein
MPSNTNTQYKIMYNDEKRPYKLVAASNIYKDSLKLKKNLETNQKLEDHVKVTSSNFDRKFESTPETNPHVNRKNTTTLCLTEQFEQEER